MEEESEREEELKQDKEADGEDLNPHQAALKLEEEEAEK